MLAATLSPEIPTASHQEVAVVAVQGKLPELHGLAHHRDVGPAQQTGWKSYLDDINASIFHYKMVWLEVKIFSEDSYY